jgi:hypothetical protein
MEKFFENPDKPIQFNDGPDTPSNSPNLKP